MMAKKRRTAILMTLIAGLIAAASMAVAAPGGFGWRGSRGWAPHGPYGRLFDPKAMVTITGTITSLTEITPMRGMGVGVHLMVKSGAETVDVHLGPSWYLESQDADLQPGQVVTIRGSRIEIDKQPVVIAVEVKRGGDVLLLRDADGTPLWAGWRRGGPPGPPR